MPETIRMRDLIVVLIEAMPKGKIIETRKLYSSIYSVFPTECHQMGFTNSRPIEEKWKNEIRYGLWDARVRGLVKHVGTLKSGEWQRL